MRLVFLLLFLIFNKALLSDSFYFNTANNHGSLGVINIPSARFYSEPSASLSFYRGDPDRKINLMLYPYKWLEAGIFYASFKGLPYGEEDIFTQDRKDKGFNFKIRLKEEDNLPAIAIGANDIGGTGYYSSEYIVSSYNVGDIDFHLGVGWGVLNHGKIRFDNPFATISGKFEFRDRILEQGGDLNIKNFFAGEKSSLFWGLNYAVNQNLIFKFENDPTNTSLAIPFAEPKSNYSFGFDYLIESNHIFGISFERGNYFSIKYIARDFFQSSESKEYKSVRKLSGDKYTDLRNNLARNSIGVSKIEKSENATRLHISQYLFNSFDQIDYITSKAINDGNLEEEIVKVYKIAGLEVLNENTKFKPKETIYRKNFLGVNKGFSLNLKPFLAGREDFIKAALLLEHDMEIIFSENLFLTSNLKVSLLDNFDDLIFPPVDTYPAQVRSDVKKYLNNIGEKPSIGRLQFEYFKTIKPNNHVLISAGIYEDMFSGYGFEYLSKDISKKFSWGFEAHQVYKRDYDFGFDLLDYKNLTYHLNFYYENQEIIPFDAKFSFGEYLAGDKGYTLQLSRRFNSGVEFGIFASFTDVTYDQFGEGSFDKGIFFRVPFGKNNTLRSFVWRPLTKDPASKLNRKNDLYSLIRKFSNIN